MIGVKIRDPLLLPVSPLEKRHKLFMEVEAELTKEEADYESGRCLRCKPAPCVTACPLQLNIPDFISALRERNLPKAAKILLRGNPFPAVCGRICAQDSQCESKCTLNRFGDSVSICALERYVADWMLENSERDQIIPCAPTGKTIAVVGGGPASLSAAAYLVTRGHEVKIYELMNDPGGVLLSEIPEFRLPKKVLIGEIARILSLGVRVECNAPVGQKISFRQLYSGYDAIVLTHGSGSPVPLGITGERLGGVCSARDYLVHANPLMEEGKHWNQLKNFDARRVVVIGGGSAAMDSARVALRTGAEQVRIIYHLSESDMPISQKVVEQAKYEGVEVLELLSPLEVLGDERGWVKGLICQAMKPGKRDLKGLHKSVSIDGDLREIEADLIIFALGPSSIRLNSRLLAKYDPFLQKNLIVYGDGSTNFPGIFVGGDNIQKQGTAVHAIAVGQKAAVAVDLFLTESLKCHAN